MGFNKKFYLKLVSNLEILFKAKDIHELSESELDFARILVNKVQRLVILTEDEGTKYIEAHVELINFYDDLKVYLRRDEEYALKTGYEYAFEVFDKRNLRRIREIKKIIRETRINW